jgi:hypothetical protein
MPYDDPGFDSDFDTAGDGNVFYSVPTDHPAFAGQQNDDDDEGVQYRGIGDDGNSSQIDASILELPVGRYDGFSRQDSDESSQLPGVGDARQRAADREFLARQLEQRKSDESTRSIREHAVAGEHRSSTPTGERPGTTGAEPSLRDQLAQSLEEAGIFFQPGPSDDRTGVEAYVHSSDEAKSNGGFRRSDNPTSSLTRALRGVVAPPKFESAILTGMMGGLKLNVAGTWILTLIIDAKCYDEVTKFSMSHGLALDISIKRKPRSYE